MRVTNRMMITNMMRNLNQNLRKMDKRQMQVATGKRIHRPSDDPVAISRILKIRADLSEFAQFQRNVDDALSWMQTTEEAAAHVGDSIQRLRELTVQASNGVLTASETQKIRSEVLQIRDHIITLGNTTYAGRYVFSGKKTDRELFDADGNYNVALGDAFDPNTVDDIMYVEVGVGETLEINALGIDIFDIVTPATVPGPPPIEVGDRNVAAGDTPGILAMIDDIVTKLTAGDTEGLTNDLTIIDTYLDVNVTARAEIGAKTSRMEMISERVADDNLNFRTLQSKLEDADMGEVTMELMNEQNVYRASLSVGARIIQPSLIDFLR
ncbi:MAG: flagellar hook-associated protein FlgL [Clostridiales bacterium]|nr:flagellar hook-associated protein FlgL [Clostridiales bacterium]